MMDSVGIRDRDTRKGAVSPVQNETICGRPHPTVPSTPPPGPLKLPAGPKMRTAGTTPAVLVKVAELAKNPNTDLTTICDLLRNDGPLVADIIRISNSPVYAPANFHGNLISAVNQIGFREVVRVINLSLSRQLFARDLVGYGLTAQDY